MRICQISRTYPRDTSPGSGSVAYNLAKRIPGEVLYIAKRLPGIYAEPPPNVSLVIIPYWEPRVPQKFGVLGGIWLAFGKAIGSGWFLLRAAPAIIRFSPDIVHVHTILPVLLGVFAKMVLRLPVVMTFHGTDFVRFRRIKPLHWLVDQTVDVVFCVSHQVADEMTSILHRAKVIAVPNGVDLELFRNYGNTRQKQVAAVGALKWQKGYEYLLQAMQMLVTQQPELQLFVAGAGPLESRLRGYVTTLGLDNNVRLLGVVSHNEVVELLNSSRVFVMASVSEGFPRVLLEAMACGTPLVVTDVGECAAAVDGAGHVVPPKSPEALANAVSRLLTDASEWHQCSERALERAQQYSWDELARKTTAVYKELVGVQ